MWRPSPSGVLENPDLVGVFLFGLWAAGRRSAGPGRISRLRLCMTFLAPARTILRIRSFLLFSIPVVLLAQAPCSLASDTTVALSERRIEADVAFLADDLLEGRATGSRGHEVAARYVATQMQLLGLRPGAAEDSWLQPVPLLEATAIVPAADVRVFLGANPVELVPAIDFVPDPGFHAPIATVSAPMVFVGFGLSAPEFGYDDFEGVDLRGKIALHLSGLPPQIPPALRVHYDKQKAEDLARFGAAGRVQLPSRGEAGRTPWASDVASSRLPRLRLLDAEAHPVDAFPGLDAAIRLSPAGASKTFRRAPKSLEAIWADAEAGKVQSFELHASASITTQSLHRRLTSHNVVGLLRGSDTELTGEYLVLMAHLDHIGRATPIDGDPIYNGALDNASGVAVMLETARLITAASTRPRRSIVFLATTAEERGLLGSRQFAMKPTVSKEHIIAAFNLDMPVALYPPAGFTAVGSDHSTLGVAARDALAAEGLSMLPIDRPERGLFAFTDQYSFVREGIPSLYVHDGPLASDPEIDAEGVFEGFLRDHYHRPSDDVGLPIHWEALAYLARVHARICHLVADDPKPPRWLPGDFYGERFGRTAP